jgi:hypothetical protein
MAVETWKAEDRFHTRTGSAALAGTSMLIAEFLVNDGKSSY